MPIRTLSSALVDQIAAGEVVERPASVVKELVENALDAGAVRVDVDIEDGGCRSICVDDDGLGILPEELELAVRRHATSKIATVDDLDNILTLGFRGEALPSIASVSRLRVASRHPEREVGAELRVDAARLSPIVPCARAAGTRVEVVDLFYNVPARRKFLRAPATERAHVARTLERFVLAHPTVAFRLREQGRVVLDAPAIRDAADPARLELVFGRAFSDTAIRIERTSGSVQLHGWLGRPDARRHASDRQLCFVNGRFVRDRLLLAAVRAGFRDVAYGTAQPAYALHLQLEPRQVDVNAHPQKLEVRFRDPRHIHDFVFRQVREALSRAQIAKPWSDVTATREASVEGRMSAELPWRLPDAPSGLGISAASSRGVSGVADARDEVPRGATTGSAAHAEGTAGPWPGSARPALGHALAQLHGVFVLAQNHRGLVVVDAHAAHERVLYERLKANRSGSAPSQLLLQPFDIELSAALVAAWLDTGSEFAGAGFEIDSVGPTRLRVRSVPAELVGEDIVAITTNTLEDVLGNGGSHHLDASADRLLANVACRAAVKANRKLSLTEMDALLRAMERTPSAEYCSHGRPTVVELALTELDRWFLRGR